MRQPATALRAIGGLILDSRSHSLVEISVSITSNSRLPILLCLFYRSGHGTIDIYVRKCFIRKGEVQK